MLQRCVTLGAWWVSQNGLAKRTCEEVKIVRFPESFSPPLQLGEMWEWQTDIKWNDVQLNPLESQKIRAPDGTVRCSFELRRHFELCRRFCTQWGREFKSHLRLGFFRVSSWFNYHIVSFSMCLSFSHFADLGDWLVASHINIILIYRFWSNLSSNNSALSGGENFLLRYAAYIYCSPRTMATTIDQP